MNWLDVIEVAAALLTAGMVAAVFDALGKAKRGRWKR